MKFKMAIFFFYLKYKIIQLIKMNTYKSYAKECRKIYGNI